MCKWLSAFVLGLVVAPQAIADGMITPRYHSHRYYRLPPERHVVEKVQPPWSGRFIINGTRFTAQTPACASWAAGERISLVAGDWHGQCVEAVFYNHYRRSSCRMWCGGEPGSWSLW